MPRKQGLREFRAGAIAKWLAAVTIAVSLTLSPTPSYGQGGKASINGTITDPSGAVIADAEVQVTNTLTGQTTKTTTASGGTYVIPLLPIGNYSMVVSHGGFRPERRTAIILTADEIATVNITLTIGAVTEAVEVSANAEMVQTTTGALTGLISEQAIVDMPLNGRNPATLVLLSPGMVNILATPAGNNQNHVGNPNDTGASANGARQGGVYYMLDGGNAIDGEQLLAAPMPNPDATQEFRVTTNNFDAQYGFAPSAVVSIVTRSGTNDWHGAAFEFLRNNDLDAANFFSHQTDTLKRNQFGGSLGGPLRHDKLFIFGNYQRTTERSTLTGSSAFVPNNSQLSGDFSDLLTGHTTNPCGSGGPSNLNFDTGQLFMPNAAASFGSPVVCPSGSALAGKTVMVKQPYPDNFISPSSFNPIATRLEESIPHSNAANGLVYLPGIPVVDNTNEFTIRADYYLSNAVRMFGRVFYNNYDLPAQSAGGDLLEAQSSWLAKYVNYSGGVVWTIRPNLLNNFVAAISPMNVASYPGMLGADGKPVSYQLYGAKINYPSNPPYPPSLDELSTLGFSVWGNTNAPEDRRIITVADSLTWIKGKHMLVVGADILHWDYTNSTDWTASPRMEFDGEVTGNSNADFLLGYPDFFEQGGGDFSQNYYTSWNGYGQDTIKLRPNFTLTVGMRWEPFLPPSVVRGRAASFRPGQQSTRYPNAPLGLVYPGDHGVSESTMDSSWTNFAPRLGIAWQPHALPNTSIRAAFGMFHAPYSNMFAHSLDSAPPFSSVYDLHYSQLGLINMSDPWASFAATGYTSPFPPFANSGVPSSDATFMLPVSMFGLRNPDFKAATLQTWNLSIQHQFGHDMLLTAAYVGSETYHLPYAAELNYAINNVRIYSQFGDMRQDTSVTNSSYHSLQVSFEKRLSHGLQVMSNYTWSKCLDVQSIPSSQTGTSSIGDPFNLAWNHGPCDMNVAHNWVSSGTWNLPSLRGQQRWMGAALGNWEVSGILTLHSGLPFSIMGGCNGNNNSGTLIGGDRADLTGEPFDVHQGSESHWLQQYFNPGAFQCNAPGTFGHSSRNFLEGPGTNNVDLGIHKSFPFSENRYRLQFRWEMFNAFNRPQFGQPNTNPVGSGFGGIYSLASPPRIMQAALKFYW